MTADKKKGASRDSREGSSRAASSCRVVIASVTAAVATLVVLPLACGGSASRPSPPSELGTTSCDHYVAAVLGVTCAWGVPFPASEVARLQQTFVPVCENAKRAPGSTLTDAQLDACASALDHPKYAFLNRLLAVASGDRRAAGPIYTIDEIPATTYVARGR